QQAIPDGQPLRDLGPDCQECQRIAQVFDEAAAEGHSYLGGEVSLNDVPSPVLNFGVADIAFGARANAVSKVDRSGNVVDEGLPEEVNLGSGIRLTWSNEVQCWLVTAFNLG
ncbi:MAG TPA: hypothetical protein VJ352_07360, partial [Geodermatophilus sp.]|nr:hypothetical protein [Geodermatophilus sp.]